jgi:hypothetical protein
MGEPGADGTPGSRHMVHVSKGTVTPEWNRDFNRLSEFTVQIQLHIRTINQHLCDLQIVQYSIIG